MDFDTKMISTEYKNGYRVGDIFCWRNTGEFWIIYTQDKTELAYFRGECRRCDYRLHWVDGEKQVRETLVSVVGPTATQLRTSSSMQASIAEDFPNANLTILTTDNEQNREYFQRYQTLVLKGVTYKIENIDNISMPGVIQMAAYEYYTNLIETDVEQDLPNAWNVQPIIDEEDEHLTDYGILGEKFIKPLFEYTYEAIVAGGEWFIAENELETH